MSTARKQQQQKEAVFEVYREGLFYMSVCTDMTPEEAAKYANCHPCGTKTGWTLSKDKAFASGEPHPFPCPDHKGRIHLLFEA